MKNIVFRVNPELDEVLEEKGNNVIMLRKIAWGESEKEYIEIRKWVMNEADDMIPLKGVTFFSEEGLDTLTYKLIQHGYGKDNEIAEAMKERNIKTIDSDDENMYDPRKELE